MERVDAAPHTVLGWVVTDLRATMKKLRAGGVVFERYEGMNQDYDDVWQSPSGACIAWFEDPDGNVLSLTQTR